MVSRLQCWRLTWVNMRNIELFGSYDANWSPGRKQSLPTLYNSVWMKGNLTGSLLNHYYSLSTTGVFRCIYFSPQHQSPLYFVATIENGISPTAQEPVFPYQSSHLATDFPPSEKTFTVLTLGGLRSNAVSYLHVLKLLGGYQFIHVIQTIIGFFSSSSRVIKKSLIS